MAAIAGGATAALLLLVGTLFAVFVLLPQFRAGTGLWASRAGHGKPRQEKDRSLARRLEVRRNSLKGVAPPAGHFSSKLPGAMPAAALADMASAYDEVRRFGACAARARECERARAP